MAQFTYEQYQTATAKAATGVAEAGSNKVGFFKLASEGAEALVRFDVSTINDLHFATVHKPVFGKKFESKDHPWAVISCCNPFGQTTGSCPLCQMAEQPDSIVTKAKKTVYVKMLVAYKDPTTGVYSAPQPVIWERPAGFAREISAKLQTYGSLKEILMKITRTGKGTDTRYIMDYAPEKIYKPEMIPADFSAFDGFQINKHSYWEKSAEEIRAFLATGEFPSNAATTNTTSISRTAPANHTTPTYSQPTAVDFAAHAAPQQIFNHAPNTQTVPAQPVVQPTPTVQPTPVAQAAPEAPKPVAPKPFTGFSF